MATFDFIVSNFNLILRLMLQHLTIVAASVVAAILTGVPIGIAITQSPSVANKVLYVAGVINMVPSIVMFGIMMPVLALINHGIGYVPAAIAVFLYSLLPIIRNTYTAIDCLDPALREAGRGMGMTTWQRLRRIEIPLAQPIIMAGTRIAVVMSIGITTIAAYVGAGGVGLLIQEGITQSDSRKLLAGAIAVSALAITADFTLAALQRWLTPRGMR